MDNDNLSNDNLSEEIGKPARQSSSQRTIGHHADDYLLMVNSVRDYAIILLDATGIVTSWNPGAERFKGYKAEEIIGQHFSRFYPAEAVGRGFPQEELYRATQDGRFEDEGWRVRKDGTHFWANVIITALRDPQGDLRGFAKLTRDLTERKRGEEEVRQARDELEKRVAERTAALRQANEKLLIAKAAAESASLAKSEFLSRMSHELRTPLNAILGFGQLLEMRTPDPGDKENINHILKSGNHLLALINEVLDIERVEAGQMELSIEPLNVGEVLREAVGLVRSLAVKSKVYVEATEAIDCQIYALADRQRLMQVFINLLSNAIKYNQVGGSVEVDCRHSTSQHSDSRVCISIRDTGVGISPQNIDKLFTPFERLDAIKTTIEGTGLGLAFSKRLVEAMHGTIRVESVLGEGSTFSIELPPAQSPSALVEQHSESLQDETKLSTQAVTVLLIEDNISNYQLIEGILSYRPNVRLMGAMQGSLGIEMAHYNSPDVILLDIHLPDIPGWEVLHRLKESQDTVDIPVIVISADATPKQIQRLLTAGATHYLTKPLKVKEFLKMLDETLEKTKARSD